MLGTHYRFRVNNTQNQAITVTLKAKNWKFSSTGAIVYSAEVTLVNAVSVAATTGTTLSVNIDNTVDLYIGADFTLSCTAAAATNGTGTVAVFLERSTDGGVTWPTSGQGEFVGAYTVTAADSTSARLKNLTVD